MSIKFAQVGAVIALVRASLVGCGPGSASTVAAPESSVSNIGPLTSSLVDTSSTAAAVPWPQQAGGTYLSTSVTGGPAAGDDRAHRVRPFWAADRAGRQQY